MTKHTDPNVQVIENATSDDIRPGDHITWELVETLDDATRTVRLEGIAHHRDPIGDWCTEEGRIITVEMGKGITITIRRPIQELPTEAGEVIVAADGRECIEARRDGLTFHAREAMLTYGQWRAAWRTSAGAWVGTVTPKHITPGTWKKADR